MTPTDVTTSETAHAKINLSLHITDQRADGYHVLDSMVMFTSFGDQISASPASELSLTIKGPFADDLDAGADNLVLKAARLFESKKGAAITLTKNLPVASGIGGGSADAAATIRALSALWGLPTPSTDMLIRLGADIPVCMTPELTQMHGIGDTLTHWGPIPMLDIVLVNPGVAVSTPAVFKGLTSKTNPPMTRNMPDPFDIDDWIKWLAQQRNDLEQPARSIAPQIDETLSALADNDGCQLARMSGSGATCFGIFTDADTRDLAVARLKERHPNWWVIGTDEAPS